MPTLAVEAGVVSRIMSQREVMISLACLSLVLLTLLLDSGNAAVLLLTSNNESRSFPDMEAGFAPHIPAGGVEGVLFAADPLDACSPLTNQPQGSQPAPFALIARGSCNFDIKVKNAQDAGFAAAVVFNTDDGIDELVTMSGSSDGINIYAVFVSWLSGELLLGVVGDRDTTCTIQPAFENTAWSIMAVSFISILAVSAVLTTFFFVRHHRLRNGGTPLLSREPSGMSATEVKALPTLVFQGPGNGSGTTETCAICLEDYEIGEKLRLLPCNHGNILPFLLAPPPPPTFPLTASKTYLRMVLNSKEGVQYICKASWFYPCLVHLLTLFYNHGLAFCAK
jgi:E3 ubiquitin-protein ligase RNF13